MRKISILFLAVAFISGTHAQDEKYFDAAFGGGGGFVPGWYIPNIDPLNTRIKLFGLEEFSTSGMFTTGGAGFIYIGFVKNLRIGGFGYSGTKSVSGTTGNFNKEAALTLGGGGLTLEYTLPFIKDIGVSVGTMIGGGSLQVELYKNSGELDWDTAWDDFLNANDNDGSEYFSRKFSNNFWIVAPTLNVEIPFYRFMAFRLGVGYQFTFGDSWEVDNDKELTSVPSDLNGNGFFIQSGIFVGFFSY